VAIESDFEITPTVQLGTAPFTLRVDWDNGEEEVEVPDWVNSDPVTLTGGWDTLGLKGVNLEIEDADGQLVTFALALHVTARLGVGISAEDVNGTLQLPTGDPAAFNVASGTSYRWRANPTNVYTGEIDGTPNETTFSWDFDGDGTEDATGVAPAYGYSAAGNYTLQLLVSETVRPDILFTVTVNAS
jgi:PKD repeat protein